MSYTDTNAETIDRWIENGWEWGTPVSHEVFSDALNGNWNVVLTPVTPVPHEWFAPYLTNKRLDGTKILGLACGGGQQMPLFAALGAECTVLDYSQKQLDSEKEVSQREGYKINIVRADMTKRLPFEDESFDLIFHPVSNCYVEDVRPVWRECFRVLKKGGVLLAGTDSGFNYLVDDTEANPLVITNKLPFNPLKTPELMAKLSEGDDGVQFSHTAEEQIGGQLEAGFILRDILEDYNNDSSADYGIPAFWMTRAVKPVSRENGLICIRDDTV